jgi:hypothetical protein
MSLRRIESIEDDMKDVVTFELQPSGERAQFTGHFFRKEGIDGVRRYLGVKPSTERLPVKQNGRIVGSLPADFDPGFVRSSSWLYDPRPGDFIRRDDHWEANQMLGPGDLEAVRGFVKEKVDG